MADAIIASTTGTTNTTKPGHERRASAAAPIKNTMSGSNTPAQRG